MRQRDFVTGAAGMGARLALPNASILRSFASSLIAQITDLNPKELFLAIRMTLFSSEAVTNFLRQRPVLPDRPTASS